MYFYFLVTSAVAALASAIPAVDPSAEIQLRSTAQAQSFASTCWDISMHPSASTLTATCRKSDGSTTSSWIDVNGCISNIDGWLTWNPRLVFFGSFIACLMTDKI